MSDGAAEMIITATCIKTCEDREINDHIACREDIVNIDDDNDDETITHVYFCNKQLMLFLI